MPKPGSRRAGNDANTATQCGRDAPCATLAAAFTVIADSGVACADPVESAGTLALSVTIDSSEMSNVLGLREVSGGNIFSYQNNRLTGNVTDGEPTGMLALK